MLGAEDGSRSRDPLLVCRLILSRSCLDYNYSVHKRISLILFSALLSACGLRSGLPSAATSTPFIITSTLPPTGVPSATLTSAPPTPSPTIVPVEGTTTTQVNVRVQPSTAARQLGILPPFIKVQIVASDAGTNWYQILYPQGPDGKGWVSAQLLVVPQGKDTIPVIGGPADTATPANGTPGAGTNGPSGVVIQQVNVRSGPGTNFDAIGTLNPQDRVTLIAKDSDGQWFQIAYPAAPDGKGWVAASFIQATGTETLPIVGSAGEVIGTGTPAAAFLIVTPTPSPAFNDEDSSQAPAVNVALFSSGTRALLYSSDVSAPLGDKQDWLVFTSAASSVLMNLACTGNSGITLELMQEGTAVPGWGGLNCGGTGEAALSPGKPCLVQISIAGGDAPLKYVRYTLRIQTIP